MTAQPHPHHASSHAASHPDADSHSASQTTAHAGSHAGPHAGSHAGSQAGSHAAATQVVPAHAATGRPADPAVAFPVGSRALAPYSIAARPRPEYDERAVPAMVLAAWAAVFVNVLAFAGNATVFPIPRIIGQLITQGSLGLALGLALLANRRRVIRPHLFLVLLTMLAIVAVMVAFHNQYLLSSVFRACRLLGFVTVLWVLSPWFGRRDMLLLRCHLICLRAVLGTVVLGAMLSPGLAFSFDGRLAGVLWPIPATQVAHYAAVLLCVTIILWLCRVVSGKHTIVTVVLVAPILLATHTRTALLAGVVGMAVAGASLFLGHARVRRTSALGAIIAVLAATVFASQIADWLLRGQSAKDAGEFTGRTKVWSQVFAMHRTPIHEMFGNGMSNLSFNGLPIDSNWVATYLDEGWFGIAVEAAILLALLLLAITHVRGPRRAIGLFLLVYCAIASVTETGLGNPSPYILDLAVAAALLAPEAHGVER